MSIQYAGGTNVNATFTGAVRQDIVTNLQTQLTNAGWTVISGGGSGDVKMQSAVTPQNLQCLVRIYDPGAGNNSARVQFRDVTETLGGYADLFLLPGAAKTFRIIANKFQFFVLVPGSVNAREFICGGVPFLESFLVGPITQAIWSHGNGRDDITATIFASFRTRCHARDQGATWNAVGASSWGPSNNGIGSHRLITLYGGEVNAGTDNHGFIWHTDDAFKIPARIAWGLTSKDAPAKVRGQLWDAVVVTHDYPMDITTTFDTHNWFNVTNSDISSMSNASLWVVIP